jgi:hypothetical protein
VRFPADGLIAGSFLRDFDLSQNKSLWRLEVSAWSIDKALKDGSSDTALKLLKYALSTIQPPKSCQLSCVYTVTSFPGVSTGGDSAWPHFREVSQAKRVEDASRHQRRFELYRELHNVRPFRLVLCANVWGPAVEHSVRTLKEAVAAENERKGFDGFSSEPLVNCNPRRACQ